MGRYARRAITVAALILWGTTAFLAVTNFGSHRVFLFFLFSAVVVGLWAVAGALMRGDRGIISATRLVIAALQETERGCEPKSASPSPTNIYTRALNEADV
jgi:hypothetical protein